MARDKRRKKNLKPKPRRKLVGLKEAFKHKNTPCDKKNSDNSKMKKEPKYMKDEVSEESSDECDQFTNFLSSLNIPISSNARETDDSEDGDSEENETMELSESAPIDSCSDISDNDLLVEESNHESGSEISVHLPLTSDDDSLGEDNLFDGNKSANDNCDPFTSHFQYDLNFDLLKSVKHKPPVVETHQLYWPVLGQLNITLPKPETTKTVGVSNKVLVEDTTYASPGSLPNRINTVDMTALHVKSQIQSHVSSANPCQCDSEMIITPLQKELFSIINNYQDLHYPSRTTENGEEVRFIYCLHVVNHILKTRAKILNHNAKIKNLDDTSDLHRDQGLVRPKVLIIVPFRDSALRIIKFITALLHPQDQGNVINKSRFLSEFTGDEIFMPFKKPKPEDYEQTFKGNSDDNFRIGLSITRKSVKLYVDFYSADIIVASPLGLRVVIGAEGEEERDYDFLASIEVLIIDQCEVFLMQNWDHILHIMEHLHLQPKEAHGTNFARVRSWAINGWSRYYRQSLVFSSLVVPEINSLFNKRCCNYSGKVRISKNISSGSVSQVIIPFPQVFQKFYISQSKSAIDFRFDVFHKKILPQYVDSITSNVLVYIPSYFDYVRVRNYFKREDFSFAQICEYTKEHKIARARDYFYHNKVHFLLYSERAHFFRRLRLKGINHLIFYQLPTFPHFYSELCNFMKESSQGKIALHGTSSTVTVLYSKCDAPQLAAVVGTDKAARMLKSERDVHMFVSTAD